MYLNRLSVPFKILLLICISAAPFILMAFWVSQMGTSNKDNFVIENTLFNLIEEMPLFSRHEGQQCTLEYANTHKLQQDHPCVINLIQKQFLKKPAPRDVPLALDWVDPNPSAVLIPYELLMKTGGFFIECGATDGERFSNSLYLENAMNWTGLLIEPNPISYQKLKKRNRKSWTLNNCLSLSKYPNEVMFETAGLLSKIQGENTINDEAHNNRNFTKVQCFPLYSLLLAHGQKKVDFLSLDVKGHELKVLKTIPWHKVDITLIIVERDLIEEAYYDAVVKYMSQQGYVHFGRISIPFAKDIIFVKDILKEFRLTDDQIKEKLALDWDPLPNNYKQS